MLPLELSVLALLALVQYTAARPLITPIASIPLYNLQASTAVLSDRATFEADKLRTRYIPSHALAKRQSSISLTNVNADSSYYAEIMLGSSDTPLKVLVDTGSADLWLASDSCSTCSSSTVKYSKEDSTSLDVSTQEFSIRYGSGEASGYLASDTMEWGSYTVQDQTFALCDNISTGLLTGQVSGLLGLGWQSIANSDAKPFWQAAGINEMSFALSRYLHDPDATATEPGGYLTLGGTNTSLYTGDINYHSLVSTTYWLLELDSFSVGDSAVSSTSKQRAAIDTGTSLIGAPVDQVADIYSKIEGSFRSTDASFEGYYEYPCDADFNTSLKFDGVDYPIYSRDFNLGTTNSVNGTDYCLGAVFELSTSGLPAWIIGNSFLKSYYTVFRADPPAVGFGNLINGEVAASGAVVSSSTVISMPFATLMASLVLVLALISN